MFLLTTLFLLLLLVAELVSQVVDLFAPSHLHKDPLVSISAAASSRAFHGAPVTWLDVVVSDSGVDLLADAEAESLNLGSDTHRGAEGQW